jgi:hypothetical protein
VRDAVEDDPWADAARGRGEDALFDKPPADAPTGTPALAQTLAPVAPIHATLPHAACRPLLCMSYEMRTLTVVIMFYRI